MPLRSDGTTGSGISDYTCPEVSINAAIYFFQFEQAGQPTTWTGRFTIAAADGATTSAPQSTVTAGSTIFFGTGTLANDAVSLCS